MAFYCNGKKGICECDTLCADCQHYDNTGGKKWQTNADRIRAMSDKELCDFLYSYKFFDLCKEGCGECSYKGECVQRLMEWLKQPAKGE